MVLSLFEPFRRRMRLRESVFQEKGENAVQEEIYLYIFGCSCQITFQTCLSEIDLTQASLVPEPLHPEMHLPRIAFDPTALSDLCLLKSVDLSNHVLLEWV